MEDWSNTFYEAEVHTGRTFKIAKQSKKLIEEAGFINVTQTYHKLPVGPWPSDPYLKEVGRWNLLHSYHGCEGWGLYLLTNVMGYSPDEAKIFIAKFKNALKDKSNHAYFEW
jgi:hypothetical protein